MDLQTDGYEVLYTANARCAIYVAVQMCKPKTVWMPSYTCQSILHRDFPIKFYEVSESLEIGSLDEVKKGDLVLFIEYFGFPVLQNSIDEAKDKGGIILFDKAQSMFSQPRGDFSVYSMTKQTGLPDGGMLFHKGEAPELHNINSTWFEKNYKFRWYRQHNEKIGGVPWYEHYLEAKEEPAPFGLYEMSDYTKNNLWQNYPLIESKTQTNYYQLQKDIWPMIELTNEDIVPSGFPIKIDNRDEVQKKLFVLKVYCPIHWECDHPLSKKILTIPCDWRYGHQDIKYIIKAVKASL